jgi:hypothetical protein
MVKILENKKGHQQMNVMALAPLPQVRDEQGTT